MASLVENAAVLTGKRGFIKRRTIHLGPGEFKTVPDIARGARTHDTIKQPVTSWSVAEVFAPVFTGEDTADRAHTTPKRILLFGKQGGQPDMIRITLDGCRSKNFSDHENPTPFCPSKRSRAG